LLNLFLLLFIGLLGFYYWFIKKIRTGLSKLDYYKTRYGGEEFISVVIPYRNETENIVDNLKSLESQSFPENKYEVIYVDDFSEDDSAIKLRNAVTKKNVKLYSVKNSGLKKAHKKHAIEYALTKAKGSIILFTDADCIVPPDWISAMVAGFEENTALISGPVKFKSSETLFDKLQALEFAGLILAGAGLIANKTPMIASSANLAFRKKVFDEVGGYRNLMNLSSGDDELLMQKIAYDTDYEVKFCFDSDAVVVTKPNDSVGEFSQQRKRWASKGFYYQNKRIIFQLVFIFFFYLGLIIQPILGVFWSPKFLSVLAVSFSVKIIIEYSVLKKGEGIVLDKIYFPLFLLAEILHIPYIIYASISGLFGNFSWKGRELER